MHLSRLPSGRWNVRVTVRGQRRSASADTRAAAERAGAQLLLELGGTIESRTATVAELLAVTSVDRGWAATYAAEVDRVVSVLPDEFTRRPARTVTPAVVAGLYRQLDSPHKARRLHEVLSAAYNRGMKLGVVASNPCALVDKPAAKRGKLTIPTDQQVVALLAAAETAPERLALRLAATLGIRRGEIVALQWGDVDTDRATVIVRRSLSYTPDAGVIEGDTKTGYVAHRVLDVDPTTADLLDAHRKTQADLADVAGLPVPLWVMSDTAGVTPWRPDRLTHVFANTRKAAGVAGVRLHDLRHYVATSMLLDGVAPHDVAHQLGHTSPATVFRVYAHFLPGRGRESVERRAARLG